MNKFHQFFYILIEIFIICSFLVFPTFYLTEVSSNIEYFFQLKNFLSIFLTSCILIMLLIYFPQKTSLKKILFNNFEVKYIIYSILSLVIIFSFAFILNKISILYFDICSKPNIYKKISLFLFLDIVLKAFYEELLYRLYLVKRVKFICSFVKKHNLKNILYFACEFLIILCFSVAHRYLGIFSCINAFFAGLVFRLLMHFTKNNLICVGMVHTIYNIFTILMSQVFL